MTSTNSISGLGLNTAVKMNAARMADTDKNTDEAQAVFATMINQTSSQNVITPDVSQQDGISDVGQVETNKSSAKPDIDRTDYRSSSDNRKISEAQDKTETAKDEISQMEDDVAEDVYEVLEENLSVTKDEIDDALSALGMDAMDLLDPANLSQIVAQLTGAEDASELLMNGDFLNVMKQMGDIAKNLADQVGISVEELQTVVEELGQTDSLTEQMTADTEVSDGDLMQTVDAAEGADDAVLRTEEQTEVQMTDSEAEQTTASAVQDTSSSNDAGTEDEMAQGDAQEDTSEMTSAKTETNTTAFEQTTAGVTTQQTIEPVPVQAPAAMAYTSNIDVADVMNQIAEYTKVQMSADTTSIEMQLNPENLGKVFLQVTSSKEGTVTAQLAAQNEAIRDILQAQVADLRQTLNQQGVKVDAIEVTVSTHEFERNLEQNAQGEKEQGANHESRSSGRRGLHRNELDGLSGLMTEEEMLAAQIMKDNGNSMDVIA